MTGNPVSFRTNRVLDQATLQNAAQAVDLDCVVFLVGPYIETTKTPRKSVKNTAAILRYKLYHALEKEGRIVTLGEYRKLIEATDPILEDHNDAAVAEISHAKDPKTDAVIILPSSPGSFLEFGAFAIYEKICPKMLVIVDAKYQHDKSYMNLGPIKGAEQNHADIQFIDYSDFDRCWEAVEKFVKRCANKKAKRVALSQ